MKATAILPSRSTTPKTLEDFERQSKKIQFINFFDPARAVIGAQTLLLTLIDQEWLSLSPGQRLLRVQISALRLSGQLTRAYEEIRALTRMTPEMQGNLKLRAWMLEIDYEVAGSQFNEEMALLSANSFPYDRYYPGVIHLLFSLAYCSVRGEQTQHTEKIFKILDPHLQNCRETAMTCQYFKCAQIFLSVLHDVLQFREKARISTQNMHEYGHLKNVEQFLINLPKKLNFDNSGFWWAVLRSVCFEDVNV